MRTTLLILAAIALAFGQDASIKDAPSKADPWKAVKDLKSGSDIRIYTHGNPKPLAAKIIEATDNKLVYVVKNAQSALDKSEIDRVDFHPPGTSYKGDTHAVTMGADGLNDSWSSSKSWSRDGWQVMYQRRL